MKKILSGALLLGAAGFMATGCFIVTSDDDDGDGNTPARTGDIAMSWSTDPGCPAGDTVELVAAPIGGGQPFVNLHDCTAGSGVVDDLPVGSYDVYINVTDGAAQDPVTFAQSFSEAGVQVLADQVTTVDAFAILIDDGIFEFDWTISENGTTVADCSAFIAAPQTGGLTCAIVDGDDPCTGTVAEPTGATCDTAIGFCRVPGADIEIYADIVDDVGVYASTGFPCAPTGSGRVEAPVASYTDLVFWLTDINTDDNEVPMIETTGVTAEIALGNQLVDLGSIVFDFDIN